MSASGGFFRLMQDSGRERRNPYHKGKDVPPLGKNPKKKGGEITVRSGFLYFFWH
jgi:hypothetical protein